MALAAPALTATPEIVRTAVPSGVTIGACSEIGSCTTGGPRVPAAPWCTYPATMTEPEFSGAGSTPALTRPAIWNEKSAV